MAGLAHRPKDDTAPPAPPLRLAAGAVSAQEVRRLVTLSLRGGRVGHLRFLRSRLRSAEDAEDVLQEFALKALQGCARLTDLTRIDAWLSVTLRNALFDRYRRNAGRARLSEAARFQPTVDDAPGENLERPLACLRAAMADLKTDAGALLRRSELDETPLKAIADALNITANNVGVRVHRARADLRRAVLAGCSTCAEPCDLAARFLARAA